MRRRNSPVLTGRWLAGMSPREAAQELLASTDLKQQRQALMQMKPHRAAALLEARLPAATSTSLDSMSCKGSPPLTMSLKQPHRVLMPVRLPQGCCPASLQTTKFEHSVACGAGHGGARQGGRPGGHDARGNGPDAGGAAARHCGRRPAGPHSAHRAAGACHVPSKDIQSEAPAA